MLSVFPGLRVGDLIQPFISAVEVTLGQTDTHGEESSAVQCLSSSPPSSMLGALLVHNIRGGEWRCKRGSSEGAGREELFE